MLTDVVLAANTTYTLNMDLINADDPESITEKIEEEDDEHMFFFAWTEGLFSDPTGDGNVDSRSNPVSYEDSDEEDDEPAG